MDLADPGIKPGFPALQADSLPVELPGKSFTFLLTVEFILIFYGMRRKKYFFPIKISH